MKALVVLLALAAPAYAYPQFQLSQDQATCTGCHLSPAGGELLSENSYAVADNMSQFGTAPEFMYRKLGLPSWLQLGGDAREQQGFDRTPQDVLIAFPMQLDVYAEATFNKISLHVTGGYRPAQWRNENSTRVWSREHYVMWAQDPQQGLFVRVGRFMPVFGLRMAEHPEYTRRFGGVPLYGETYGAAIEYVKDKYEAHLTGFIRDPLIDPVMHDNGVAAYGEYRLNSRTQVGAGGMATVSAESDKKFRGEVTGKYWMDPVLISGEVQFVNERIPGGGAPNQIVSNLKASLFFAKAMLFDLGLGYFNSNIRISQLDRECVDGNLHWFTTSHFEMILNTRFETIGFGKGALSGGWALLQLHYRL